MHRAVTTYFNILLTEYGNLYTQDYLLPMGRLREPRRNAARADIIIVTKCPRDLSPDEKNKLREEIKPASDQHLFFSTLRYHTAYRSEERRVGKECRYQWSRERCKKNRKQRQARGADRRTE